MTNKPTLFKRPNSRWWWLSYYDDHGRLQMSCKKFALSIDKYTKEQAEAILLKELHLVPEAPEPGAETLSWLKDEILRRFQIEGMRKTTIKEYRIALDHLINHCGADFKINEITRAHVYKLQESILKKGSRPPTVNKICRHLRGAFERMVDLEILDRNPFRKFPSLEEIPAGPQHFTPKQLQHFLDIVIRSSNEEGKRLVFICIATGIRRIELLEIQREDIDLENNRVRVMNAKHKRRVKRWITIPKSVHNDFKWFLDRDPGEHPFKVCHPDTFTHWVKDWIREAGMPESLHLHSLRHTFTTLALQAGESAWRLKDHLGHADLRTTEGYAHTDVDDGVEINIGIDLSEHR